MSVGDINQDDRIDLCTQTQNYIHLFIGEGVAGDQWRHIKIKKPDAYRWIGRPIKFADVDNDGNLDIVGALIHHDGLLPKDKASVFWLKYYEGYDNPNWNFFPIKWSDGHDIYHEWIGEKWDHLLLRDVDGDGDIDLIGNVEEHYRKTEKEELPTSFFSVVWFEKPLY